MTNDNLTKELNDAYREFNANLDQIQKERWNKFLELMNKMDEEDIKQVKNIIQNI